MQKQENENFRAKNGEKRIGEAVNYVNYITLKMPVAIHKLTTSESDKRIERENIWKKNECKKHQHFFLVLLVLFGDGINSIYMDSYKHSEWMFEIKN